MWSSSERAGYDADRVYDEGLSGEDDVRVWEHACAAQRLFITLDLDFSDVRRFPPGTHPGSLLLRPPTRDRRAVLAVLARVVREVSLDTLRGCLTAADTAHTRIRRPPDPEARPLPLEDSAGPGSSC